MAKFTSNTRPNQQQQLIAFLRDKQNLTILTGAGISAGCGIPTYRDEAGNWRRPDPIQHKDFMSQNETRQRYWLRSFSGWPAFASALPSPSHRIIAEMESLKIVKLVVTQNVDRLHQKAGSLNVVDLHGRLDEVICMSCAEFISRQAVQKTLKRLNPFLFEHGNVAPDGDADVPEDAALSMVVPCCSSCGGILKPNVVFFGDTVDKVIVQRIYQQIANGDGLLIIGSSLQVFSGYRFCRHAVQQGKPVASINPGLSRGDDIIDTLIRGNSDELLSPLAHNFY